ncbi:ABZJ_00895 family protein [Psychrobacter sp. 2Y5]|uniref:ABZJ_00895 family protein n=1 Tax=unclassified Psychrobacter TaxID=196806 RepID=UPI003F45109C
MSRKSANLSKSKAQSVISPSTTPVKLAQYLGFFMVGYILASALLMLLQTKIALNPQLVTLLSILVGAFIAVHKFIKHQRRAIRKDEMSKLAIGGTVIVWLLNALYFLAIWLWLFDEANRQVFIEMSLQQPLPLLVALIAIMLLTFISAGVGIWLFNRLLSPK